MGLHLVAHTFHDEPNVARQEHPLAHDPLNEGVQRDDEPSNVPWSQKSNASAPSRFLGVTTDSLSDSSEGEGSASHRQNTCVH